VELADETGRWMLGPRGRFSHGRAMLEAALSDSGFQIAEVREEALRLEAGKPVQGLIFLATARAADA
jgi:predicted TPR repeat methyltransferase